MQTDNTNTIEAKKKLIDELNDVYNLIETSYYALMHHGVTELSSVGGVLSIAYEKLFKTCDELRIEIEKEEKEEN